MNTEESFKSPRLCFGSSGTGSFQPQCNILLIRTIVSSATDEIILQPKMSIDPTFLVIDEICDCLSSLFPSDQMIFDPILQCCEQIKDLPLVKVKGDFLPQPIFERFFKEILNYQIKIYDINYINKTFMHIQKHDLTSTKKNNYTSTFL